MSIHTFELAYLNQIADLRTPLANQFFKLWNYVDSTEFVFFLIPLVWVLAGRQWGLRLLVIITLSGLINLMLKNLFELPRPLHLEPQLGLVPLKTYGFPSGAAQSSVILSGLWILTRPSTFRLVTGIAFALLLSFSRLYLGVHFFTDILGGWLIGLTLLLIYLRYSVYFEAWSWRYPTAVKLLLFLTVFLSLQFAVSLPKSFLFMLDVLLGAMIGALIFPKLLQCSWPAKFLQLFLMAAGLLTGFYFWEQLHMPWMGFLLACWLPASDWLTDRALHLWKIRRFRYG